MISLKNILDITIINDIRWHVKLNDDNKFYKPYYKSDKPADKDLTSRRGYASWARLA